MASVKFIFFAIFNWKCTKPKVYGAPRRSPKFTKSEKGQDGIAPSPDHAEISHGLKRLKASNLIVNGHVNAQAALEFLVHGLKYICPAEFGMPALGLPTSFAHPDFKFVKYESSEVYVWPDAKGKKRGIALLPIYPTFPQACAIDNSLYRLAALVEMVRAGRARERQIAANEIKNFLEKPNDKKRHSS